MLTDSAARWLLVLHTALGVAAVGSATHLVLWLRKYLNGQSGKRRAVIQFSWLVLAFQVGAFIGGNLMYPTYKVEVRVAYLENTGAIAADAMARSKELEHLASREGTHAYEAPATADLVKRAAHAARWFDVKEHWIAMGIFASIALLFVLAFWDPRQGPALKPIVMSLALIAAGTVWLGAIIGVLTASWRAV
ncbi:MAG: hypothetical protein JWO36_843 [Myxococcales bacterium]|nr:hypothetical protein [Myxococcales bacterium]